MKAGTILGHSVEVGPVSLGATGRQIEMKLVRRWWAPLPMAWCAAGMFAWWWSPFVFAYALIYFARAK